jgi:hypothetical protein
LAYRLAQRSDQVFRARQYYWQSSHGRHAWSQPLLTARTSGKRRTSPIKLESRIIVALKQPDERRDRAERVFFTVHFQGLTTKAKGGFIENKGLGC